MPVHTQFGSLEHYDKGGVSVTGDDQPSRYLFSNMFEVANRAAPWERVVVAKNLEYTIECARVEGDSPWYICAHDETALLMDGEAEIHFVKPDDVAVAPDGEQQGAVRLGACPAGKTMGYVRAGRGHLTLLPAGAAYQLRPSRQGVVLFQSVLGDESIERWGQICQR